MSPLSGIVLAAGEGRRMGGVKALLRVQGATLVEQHVARLIEVGCTSVAVVVRPSAAEAVSALLRRQSEARIVAVLTGSQSESLAAGLRALPPERNAQHDVVVITPVDLLPPQAATYRLLLAALDADTLAVTPQHAERGGHPVIARRALLARYEAMQPLRDVLAEVGPLRRRIQVDDPRVLGDFDTPADLPASGTTP